MADKEKQEQLPIRTIGEASEAPTRSKKRRKYDQTNYVSVGRPPRDISKKVSHALRFLATKSVQELVEAKAEEMGLSPSDLLRLALYRFLEQQGELEKHPELRTDTTFDTLRGVGLV